MDFFGIGTWEILLVFVVAMIIWGPKKLPEIARKIGKTVRAIKKVSYDFTTAVTREIEQQEKNSASQPEVKTVDPSRKLPANTSAARPSPTNNPAEPTEKQQHHDEQ